MQSEADVAVVVEVCVVAVVMSHVACCSLVLKEADVTVEVQQ